MEWTATTTATVARENPAPHEPVPDTMRAWVVDRPSRLTERPLVQATLPVPAPRSAEILVRVRVCAVCRTDLNLAQGVLPPHAHRTVPGHEVVGTVVAHGDGAHRFGLGARVGVAWLHETCAVCRHCLRGAENLCGAAAYTGWNVHGGFAEYATVREDFAYPLPTGYSDDEIAPLLCAGITGYRALRRADLPYGGRLGIFGFGASAHVATQLAIAEGATVHVMTWSEASQRVALELGAASAAGAYEAPPEPLDSAILFAPVGDLVLVALQALDDGGTLAVAGIHVSAIPRLLYRRDLFQERTLRSVTANTRRDGEELLALAARHRLQVVTTPYPFSAADVALADVETDAVRGAAVLHVAA